MKTDDWKEQKKLNNENIENIKDQMAHFEQSNHFQIDEIEEKGNSKYDLINIANLMIIFQVIKSLNVLMKFKNQSIVVVRHSKNILHSFNSKMMLNMNFFGSKKKKIN